MKRLSSFFAALCVLAGICLASVANAGEVKPVASLALGAYGYDLVALFPGGSGNPNDGRLTLGSADHEVEHKGVVFRFKNLENKDRFSADPEKWMPGAGGYCLLGLHRRAVGAPHKGDMPPPGHPGSRTFANGKWFFHGGPEAERVFEKDPATIDKRGEEALRYFNGRLAKKASSTN